MHKIKKIVLVLLFCFIPLAANAKITVFDTPLVDMHIATVKGQLFDSTKLAKNSGKKDYSDLFARAIDWLQKAHKSKKIFELSNLENQEAEVILASVYFISKVEKGEYVPNIMPSAIGIWEELGKLVVVDKVGKKWKLKTIKKD